VCCASAKEAVFGKIGAVIVHEIRKMLPPFIFFLFQFHMIALTRTLLQSDFRISALRATGATVGALVVAKAILIVDALPVSKRSSGRRWIHVLWKTLLYGVVVIVFKVVEELIPLISEHGGLGPAVRTLFGEISWPLVVIMGLWVFGGLLLYCLISEMIDLVGADRVKEIFFGTQRESTGE
jgi:hypothetical protein